MIDLLIGKALTVMRNILWYIYVILACLLFAPVIFVLSGIDGLFNRTRIARLFRLCCQGVTAKIEKLLDKRDIQGGKEMITVPVSKALISLEVENLADFPAEVEND